MGGQSKTVLRWTEYQDFYGDLVRRQSKRSSPPFKILNALDVEHRNLEMYAMTAEKTTPGNFEKGFNITNVPTFIFYKNGNEMNRFVELPVENLAQDLAKIIKGKPTTIPINSQC